MSLAMKLMIFTLVFNVSVGMVAWAGGGAWTPSGANPNAWQNNAADVNNQFNSSVTVPVEGTQSFWYSILDTVSLGLFSKIQIILNNTIFRIPSLLVSMGIIPLGLAIFLNFILTVIYTIGVFELFTSKNLMG